MKVLFISKYVPYRANSGITVKIHNLLSCLSRVCDVTCVYLCEDESESEIALKEGNLYVHNHVIPLKRDNNSIKRYINHLIDLVYVKKAIKIKLSALIESKKPDIIWLEFGYICQLIPFLKNFNIPIYYCSHNSQFKLDYNVWKADSAIFRKLKMAPFMLFYMVHEKLFFRLADKVLCICQQDLEYYKKFIPESRLDIVPYFFDGSNLPAIDLPELPERYICVVGSMYSYQNYSAAMYVLENIWPMIHKKDKNLYLCIVGRLPPEKSSECLRLKGKVNTSKNVIFTGEVDTVIPYVKKAMVNIVPILIGSGVRTKIIESAACKTPVVSTSIGAEGLPFVDGDSIYIADTPEMFSEKILQLTNSNRMRFKVAERANRVYNQELSLDAGIRKLSKLLSKEETI